MKRVCGCGAAFSVCRLETHTTNEFGIPITLRNSAEQKVCIECGATKDVFIPHPVKLMAAAALFRCSLPERLNGDEQRFIRNAMDVSSKELASLLSADPATVSRWESGKQAMGASVEKLLRYTAIAKLCSEAPAVEVEAEDISKMDLRGWADDNSYPSMAFVLTKYRKEELYSDSEIAA